MANSLLAVIVPGSRFRKNGRVILQMLTGPRSN